MKQPRERGPWDLVNEHGRPFTSEERRIPDPRLTIENEVLIPGFQWTPIGIAYALLIVVAVIAALVMS